jgi:hypothetical protein
MVTVYIVGVDDLVCVAPLHPIPPSDRSSKSTQRPNKSVRLFGNRPMRVSSAASRSRTGKSTPENGGDRKFSWNRSGEENAVDGVRIVNVAVAVGELDVNVTVGDEKEHPAPAGSPEEQLRVIGFEKAPCAVEPTVTV